MGRLSGPVLLHLPPGVSILAASVSVPQLDAVPLLVVAVVLHPLDVAVATILHVRMTAVIETMNDVTATALAAQRTGIVRRVAKTAPTETIGKLPWNLPHKLTMSWTQLSNRSAHLSETYVFGGEKLLCCLWFTLFFFPRRQIITSLLCF